MTNFEGTGKEYRDRVMYQTEDLFDTIIKDNILKGGIFDATAITRTFQVCLKTAQLMIDLSIGCGLSPLGEKRHGYGDEYESEAKKATEAARVGIANDTPVGGGRVPNAFVRDAVGDLGPADTEGPRGGARDAGRVPRANSEPNQTDDHGSTGSGEVNSPEQQSESPVTGPGTGGRHFGGPAGS